MPGPVPERMVQNDGVRDRGSGPVVNPATRMATKSKQGLPARIMDAIGDALTPPMSDESGETPSASEVRKMKSAVAGSGAGARKKPARKAKKSA